MKTVSPSAFNAFVAKHPSLVAHHHASGNIQPGVSYTHPTNPNRVVASLTFRQNGLPVYRAGAVPRQTIKVAVSAIGTLSKPSKMPGRAWGIPAQHCNRGAKLHACAGTVCSDCYALKGNYTFTNVQESQEKRHQAFLNLPREEWITNMTFLVGKQAKEPWFRVYDSGDVQSTEQYDAWIEVASRLADIMFWIATRERSIIEIVRCTRRACPA